MNLLYKIILILLCFLLHTDESKGIEYAEFGGHPRLMFSNSDKPKVDSLLYHNKSIQNLHNYIIKISDEMLDLPVLERKITGLRMLFVSREAIKRILYLSYSYRISLKKKYADRAIKEICNVCGFKDWNPSHFLDVAEMTMAVSIGYDWLYDIIDEKSRRVIVDAIINKSFMPSLDDKKSRFFKETNNWNQVCNASLLFASIAFSDDIPELSNRIIVRCLSSNPRAIAMYGPDGGYPEGYNYWNYGTMYQVLLIDALERSFGNDFGLGKTPGFMKTGSFAQFMTTPLGNSFNFGDSPRDVKGCIPLFWFAFKNNDSSLIYNEMQLLEQQNYNFEDNKFLPLIPLLLSRFRIEKKYPSTHFWINKGKTPIFVYRSGWNCKNDTYLGVKGGSPSTSHAHMDSGSFIYEYDGVRWATDLGMQDYHSLENKGIKLWDSSQDGQRWDILRFRNDHHNTLTIDSARHNVKANAEIIHFFIDNDRKGAVVDLTSTLGKIRNAHRSVSLDSNEHLIVTDSIETGKKSIHLSWVMVTSAEAKIINDTSIILEGGGKKMKFVIDANVKANLHIWDNEPLHDYDLSNDGTRRVGFTSCVPSDKRVVFNVRIYPYDSIRM